MIQTRRSCCNCWVNNPCWDGLVGTVTPCNWKEPRTVSISNMFIAACLALSSCKISFACSVVAEHCCVVALVVAVRYFVGVQTVWVGTCLLSEVAAAVALAELEPVQEPPVDVVFELVVQLLPGSIVDSYYDYQAH